MNIYYLSALLTGICFSSINYAKQEQAAVLQDTLTVPAYIMRVTFPATFKKTPALYGYYKGYKLEFDENMCIIPENNPTCSYFTVIFTEQIRHACTRHSTLEHLERVAHKPCRLFHVSRRDKEWHVQEEQQENIPVRLPEEALVLLINPAFIDTLKPHEGMPAHAPIVTLPTLTIKPNITQEEFDINSLYTLFASLDVNAVHTPVKKAVKKERSLVISMRNL